MSVIGALIPAIQVVVVGRLTNEVAAGHRGNTVVWLAIATAAAVGLVSAVGDLEIAATRLLSSRLSVSFKRDVAQRMARETPETLADPRLAAQARESLETIREYARNYVSTTLTVFGSCITIPSLVWALWGYSWIAAILIIVSLIPTLFAFALVAKITESGWRGLSEQERRVRYSLDQLTYQQPAAELASLGSSDQLVNRITEHADARHRLFTGMTVRSQLCVFTAGLASSILLGVALWMVTLSPTATAAGAASGVLAVISGSTRLLEIGYALGDLLTGSGPVRHLQAFIGATRERTPLAEPVRPQRVVVNDISYSYPGSSTPALQGVSLGLRQGQMIGIVGANGAGKTTLVQCLIGAFHPSAGSVWLDESALDDLDEATRLATFSALVQDFGKYEFTIRESLALGRPHGDADDAELWRALEFSEADAFVRALPDGLDSQLGQQWGGTGISGGQWQRLSLARIALKDAPIWVLDEPTSAVDAETEAEIFSTLYAHRHERMTVVISHRAWTLRRMDCIYVLHEGRLIQEGTFDELMSIPGHFREMFAEQYGMTLHSSE